MPRLGLPSPQLQSWQQNLQYLCTRSPHCWLHQQEKYLLHQLQHWQPSQLQSLMPQICPLLWTTWHQPPGEPNAILYNCCIQLLKPGCKCFSHLKSHTTPLQLPTPCCTTISPLGPKITQTGSKPLSHSHNWSPTVLPPNVSTKNNRPT